MSGTRVMQARTPADAQRALLELSLNSVFVQPTESVIPAATRGSIRRRRPDGRVDTSVLEREGQALARERSDGGGVRAPQWDQAVTLSATDNIASYC